MRKRVLSLLLVFSIIFILLPINSFADTSFVNDFKSFKAALESPSVDIVILTGRIDMQKESITINPNKTGLLINGNGNQIVQVDSSSSAYSIQFDSSKSNIRQIIFNDVKITGQSRKGFIYIPNCSRYSDFAVVFNNVDYTGPELIRAKNSNIVINNTPANVITVQPGHNDSTGYLVEGMNTLLRGTVVINKQVANSCRTLFSVSNKGSLVIDEGANVTITNNTMDEKVSKKSGFAYFASCSTSLIFGDNCVFDYTGASAFTYGCDIGEVYVGRGSLVNVVISGNLYSCDGMLGVKTGMLVESGARLNLIAVNNTNNYPVVEFNSGSVLIFNAPREVLIYNATQKAHCHGLAIHAPCTMAINYTNVRSVEYWVKNSAPYTNLGAPTYLFSNGDAGGTFDATLGMSAGLYALCAANPKSITTDRYVGATPFTSASLKDVNVVRIRALSAS